MSFTNDGDTTNREKFNEPIEYMNDSSNNNCNLFTTCVLSQKPITYKHPYTCLYLQLLHNILVQDMQIENIFYFT